MKNFVLWLFSLLYSAITGFRNWLYDSKRKFIYQSKLPVASVGNLTVGGNAKTPLCIFLATELSKRDRRPVILSRGYGGKEKGPKLVNETDLPYQVGDEPYLLFRNANCPIVVSRDRVKGAKLIEDQNLGDVIILDDGLQHRRLARDVDIISVNVSTDQAVEKFLNPRLLPLGLFREDRDKALKRVDMVVFAERAAPQPGRKLDSRLFDLVPRRVQLYRSFLLSEGVVSSTTKEILERQDVFAFCGIANPEGFQRTLEKLGYTVKSFRIFRDHHVFTESELEELLVKAGQKPLVCTSKDLVKIPDKYLDKIYTLPVKLEVAPKDAFTVQILKMLHNAKTFRIAELQSEASSIKSVSKD